MSLQACFSNWWSFWGFSKEPFFFIYKKVSLFFLRRKEGKTWVQIEI